MWSSVNALGDILGHRARYEYAQTWHEALFPSCVKLAQLLFVRIFGQNNKVRLISPSVFSFPEFTIPPPLCAIDLYFWVLPSWRHPIWRELSAV